MEVLVKNLVDDPEAVEIRQIEGEKSVIFEVKVASQDVGKVIGKQGRIIRAIRTVVKAAAAREGKHVVVEVLP